MDDIILDDMVEEGRLVSLAHVKQMLEEAQEGREEMTYEQKIALEHARRFSRVDVKTAEAITKDAMEALPGLEEKYAIRIADLVPQHVDDVLGILQKARMDLTPEDCQKIIDVVDKHYVA